MERVHVARGFVELLQSMLEGDDHGLLETVTQVCAEFVDTPLDSVLLARTRPGRVDCAASIGSLGRQVAESQVADQQGPGFEAIEDDARLVIWRPPALRSRWPRVADVLDGEAQALVAMPMRLGHLVTGSLQLVARDLGPVEPPVVGVLQALADSTAAIYAEVCAQRAGTELNSQLQEALDSRVVIEQAKGALAVAHGCDVDEAFGRLRAAARGSGRPLREVAARRLSELGALATEPPRS